jgi:hypothetical protein
MNDSVPLLAKDLQENLDLYRGILQLLESENQALRDPGASQITSLFASRKEYAPKLDQSLARLRRHRADWSRLTAEERARHPDVATLLRLCQDTLMKLLVLDRSNEQTMLRRGLLAPRHLPSHQSRRPHFVADLYRRQSDG